MPYAIDRETGAPLRYDAEVRNAVVTFGPNPGDPLSVCQKGYLAHLGMTRERAEEVAYEYRQYRAEVERRGYRNAPPFPPTLRMVRGGYDLAPENDPVVGWLRRRTG